ncbi:type I-C CRISPR-associated protein Cas5c [Flexilinea flocculi]|uniref:pre-crRNA processing endonuclease n=1 Tax=Flexilinea flocculi TaxID=1678840 RepID=A0A0K8P9V6_9CHLR|nr:type I-C CRISPR-associated protein Cas5c [Flexilinea flocculi]NMB93090.1 type I-C CRISPR-associated protein Cas5 [Flexilinea flocculi]GAP39421.1 CRISPR-associated protein, Cas5d family [Flexilinea flocculi]
MGFGITIRVQGPYALFTRPEMKVERVSYDVITPSAARGIIEAVYWKPAIRWVIDKIHVLNEIKYTNIRRNEVSEKASTQIAKRIMNGANDPFYLSANDNRQQRASMVLKDVDYCIEAHFEIVQENAGPEDTVEKHYNIVLRRLKKGQYFNPPCLGTREFGATVELVEDTRTIPPSSLTGSKDLGWMLYDLDFSDPEDIRPRFFKAEMINGVIDLTTVGLVG